MARTQKNKATASHLGVLKAKLAKLRRELITPKGGGGGSSGDGFDVAKTGDARVGFVGELYEYIVGSHTWTLLFLHRETFLVNSGCMEDPPTQYRDQY